MKVKIKKDIIYTTNQIDKKILGKGEHDIEENIYNILKHNPNLEVLKEEEVIKHNDLEIKNNDLNIENNDLVTESENIKDTNDKVTSSFSKRKK